MARSRLDYRIPTTILFLYSHHFVQHELRATMIRFLLKILDHGVSDAFRSLKAPPLLFIPVTCSILFGKLLITPPG